MPSKSSDRWHNTTDDPTTSLQSTSLEHTEVQEEAIGYDNTILLSARSLGETGNVAINLHQAQCSEDEENDSQEDNSMSNEDIPGNTPDLTIHNLYRLENDEANHNQVDHSNSEDSDFFPDDDPQPETVQGHIILMCQLYKLWQLHMHYVYIL